MGIRGSGITVKQYSMMRFIFFAGIISEIQSKGDDKWSQEIDNTYKEKAATYCANFYNPKGAVNTSVEYLANGAESVIYKCQIGETDSLNDQVPEITALKIYFRSETKNFTEMKEIDFQLAAQDVRYPVYEYMELDGGEWAKFEQFLSGKKDFQGLQDQFKDPVVYEEIIRNIARLHSAEVSNINQMKYKQPYAGWWNTYQVKAHFEALQWFFPESKAVLDMLGWTEEQFWAEVEFVEKVLQTHTDQNENSTSIRMCHNDLHPGNIMRNKDGDFDPNELIFVDFDQAAYGFRMFDTLYWAANTNHQFSIDEIMNMMQVYVDEQTYDNSLTVATLMEELQHISPYFWLERIVFLVGFGFKDQGMVDLMKQIYAESIKPFNRRLPSAPCRDSIIGISQMIVSGIMSVFMSFV